MLSSLEMLLRKAEEWEQFAASHTSLRDGMKMISKLIERWRRLELQSWEHLLRCKELTYVKQAMQHWYTLHHVLHSLPVLSQPLTGQTAYESEKQIEIGQLAQSSHEWQALASTSPSWMLNAQIGQRLSASVDDACVLDSSKSSLNGSVEPMTTANYLSRVFDLVDGFLRSSIVGQFPARLHLVRLFAVQLQQQLVADTDARLETHCSPRKQVANIVYGVWQYYDQYLPIIRQFQDSLKSPIQDKLRDQSKIGKWDQLHTYAVIEHSERIHRKLNKLIRQYQVDVLEFPAFGVIRKDIMRDLVSDSGDLRGAITVPTVAAIVPHLKSLGDTFEALTDVPAEALAEGSLLDVGPLGRKRQKKFLRSHVTVDVGVRVRDVVQLKTVCRGFEDSSIPSSDQLNFLRKDVVVSGSATGAVKNLDRLLRTPQLLNKMNSYLADLFGSSSLNPKKKANVTRHGDLFFGKQAFRLADDYCADIFARINELRLPTATKPMKQRAVADMLGFLKDQQISHLKSSVSPQVRCLLDVMSVSPLLPCEFGGDLFRRCGTDDVDRSFPDVLDQAERYYARNVAELSQLRTQAVSSSSKDINNREISIMLGLSENMFFSQLRMRSVLTAALADTRRCMTELENIRACVEIEDLPKHLGDHNTLMAEMAVRRSSQTATLFYTSHLLPCCQVLLDNLIQLKKLIDVMTTANLPENIEEAAAIPTCDTKTCIAAASVVAEVTNTVVGVIMRHKTELDGGLSLGAITGLFLTRGCTHVTDAFVCQVVNDIIPGCVSKMFDSERLFCSLLSDDIVSPFLQKFIELRDCAISQYSVMHSSIPAVCNSEQMTNNPRSVPCAPLFSGCLDESLIAVQKLLQLPKLKLTKDGEASSDANVVKGFFEETFEIIGALPMPSQSDGEVGELPSLQEYWSLSLLSCGTLAQCARKLRESMHTVSSSVDNATSAEVFLEVSSLAHAVLPVARRIIDSLIAVVSDTILTYKSLGKMLYVSLRIFRTLLAKGICSDEAKDEEKDGEGGDGVGDMQFTDDVEGTGMGEGQGKKDVSDEIQNEEQLMDLKNPDAEGDDENKPKDSKKQLNKEEAEQGVEMSQDFDGEMFDVPEDLEESEGDEENDSKEDLDREMGEAKPEDIVDEKQWDEEDDGDGPDKNEKDREKFEKDSKMKGEELEGEMRTKDEEDNENVGTDDEGEDDPKASKEKGGDGNDDNEDDEDKINEDLAEKEQEKALGVDVREGDDDENEPNEKPDNSNGEDETGGQNPDEDQDFPENMNLDGGKNNDEDEPPDEGKDDEESDVSVNNDEDKSPEEAAAEENIVDTDDRNDDNQMHGQQGNIPDSLEEQDDRDDLEQHDEVDDDEAALNSKPKSEKLPPAFGVADKAGADAVIPDNASKGDQDKPEPNSSDQDVQGPKGDGGSSTGEGNRDGATEQVGQHHRETSDGRKKEQRSTKPPNPFDSKGDINQMWKKRLNLVDREEEGDGSDDGKKDPELSDEPPSTAANLFEKTAKEERHTDQVLDVADESDAVQLNREQNEVRDDDLNIMEDDMDVAEVRQDQQDKKKRDREKNGANDKFKGGDEKRPKVDQEDSTRLPDPISAESADDIIEVDEEDNYDDSGNTALDDEYQPPKDDSRIHSDHAFLFGASSERSNLENVKTASDFLAVSYEEPLSTAADMSRGKRLWIQHRQLTEAFSARLCEQLRLILEPSLCSRLQGDYRTGKRINMRKVIGYVSSGFRKDKIWLRRTKPAKREYQVMIMIDNSSSMGPAGQLALSSLCMIANAMTRLEVGDLSVVSFADQISVVHPFGKPFTDDSGAEIFSQFDFIAGRTMLSESMEAVRPIFEAAQSNSASNRSSAVALQLCFIISDAKLDSDNRARLDTIVRDFAEQHVLVVLIVIDRTTNPRDSIFNTKTVEFRDNKVVTRPYLENFPFPYYIAIQKIDNLPDVLSDALKQWFEMIAAQMNG
jgi:hypothetical protein